MSKNYMVIIEKSPRKKPHIIKIPKRLKDMSKLVGGVIEETRYEDVLIIYNKNQKDENLIQNKLFDNISYKGTILIVGNDEKVGDVMSLRKKQISKYMLKLNGNRKLKENEL